MARNATTDRRTADGHMTTVPRQKARNTHLHQLAAHGTKAGMLPLAIDLLSLIVTLNTIFDILANQQRIEIDSSRQENS